MNNLYEWQRSFVEWGRGRRQVGLEAATGSGKTLAAMHLVRAWLAADRDLQGVVIITPTQVIARQWLKYTSLLEPLQVGTWWGEFPGERDTLLQRVTVAVVNTAFKHIEVVKREAPWLALVADETHHYLAGASHRQVLAAKWRRAALLSATLTPLQKQYAREFFPEIGWFKYGVEEARQEGVVSDYEITTLRVGLTPAESVLYDDLDLARRRLGISGEEAVKALTDKTQPLIVRARAKEYMSLTRQMMNVVAMAQNKLQKVVELAHSLVAEGRRVLVFCWSVPQAKAIHRQLGDNALLITATQKKGLDLFPQEKRIIVCIRVLDEGYDVPLADAAIIAGGWSIPRQMIQRMGRVLRRAPDKDKAIIYQVICAGTVEEWHARRRLSFLSLEQKRKKYRLYKHLYDKYFS